jgi:hypothetical protein
MRRITAIAFAAAAAFAGDAAAQTRWSLGVDGGGEVDTNIHRVESVPGDEASVVAAPLLRTGARGGIGWRRGRHAAGLQLHGLSKLFMTPDGQSENVAALALDGGASRAVGKDGARLGVRGSYYNAAALNPIGDEERELGRNFATAMGEIVASVPGPASHQIVAGAGYRDFVYKPDSDFDWHGEHVRLSYATELWRGDPDAEEAAAIELRASYGLGRRDYTGAAFANGCGPDDELGPECFVVTDNGRRDLHHTAAVESSYTGERIYAARYQLQVTDSNSFGQSLVRQRLELSLTSRLPATRIFATLKLALQVNHFLDPLLLARDVNDQSFVSIDDENRNAAVVHLSRQIGERVAIEARYALYTNEIATDERPFRRHTAYGGIVWNLGP